MRRTHPPLDISTYDVFYNTYAPKLWGIILMARLPVESAERILVRTLIKAWQQREQHPFTAQHFLTKLIRLAYAEGLPLTRVQASLQSALRS